jgi:hypothetical protein
MSVSGELGLSLFPRDMKWALHSGAVFEAAPFFNVAVRQQWVTWVTSIHSGLRYLPTMGDLTYCQI